MAEQVVKGRTKNGANVIPMKMNDTRYYKKLLAEWGLTDEQVAKIEGSSKIKLKNIIDYDELQAEIETETAQSNSKKVVNF